MKTKLSFLFLVLAWLAGIPAPADSFDKREARLDAVEKMTDQSLLSKIAVADKDMLAREAATKKLTDRDLLAKIAVTDKDKTGKVFIAAVSRFVYFGDEKKLRGDLEGAIVDYTTAIELRPHYPTVSAGSHTGHFDPTPTFEEAYIGRGGAKRAKGDLDGALADYTAAIELTPPEVPHSPFHPGLDVEDTKQLRSDAYSSRAAIRTLRGDLDGAKADYAKAVGIAPLYPVAYRTRGNAEKLKGDLEGAIADYTKAIELTPYEFLEADNLKDVYSGRGDVKALKGDSEGAKADHAKAIGLLAEMQASSDPRTVTGEREVYIWRASAEDSSTTPMPRWRIAGVLGAAGLGRHFAANMAAEAAETFGEGSVRWQVAPESEGDVCTLESGGASVNAGEGAREFRGPMPFRSGLVNGERSWVVSEGSTTLLFRPMLGFRSGLGVDASSRTLVLGGGMVLVNGGGGSTAFIPMRPATVTGTIRFPKDRWTSTTAGVKIMGGGLQFDETGVFLMPGTQYLKEAR